MKPNGKNLGSPSGHFSMFVAFILIISGLSGLMVMNTVVAVDPPILIDHNDDFHGYSGSGTQNDPWIITETLDCTGEDYCIRVDNSNSDIDEYFTITGCDLSGGWLGINLEDIVTGTGKIIDNDCYDCGYAGILIEYSDEVTIEENDCNDNNYGIMIHRSDSNIIDDNICGDGSSGAFNAQGGIVIESGDDNIIQNNFIDGINGVARATVKGITIASFYSSSLRNHVAYNEVTNCVYGIYSEQSNANFYENDIIDNTAGVYFTASSVSNNIVHNDFINNTEHAYDYGTNNFFDAGYGYPWGGNYWEGHDCVGDPSDGSYPYEITGAEYNFDWYPWETPDGWL